MPPSASNKQRVIELNQQINALGRNRQLTEALALLPQMRSEGLKPTAVTFNVLLNACTRCGDNTRAAALLAEMRSVGLQPNVITYATVAKGLCLSGALSEAEQVLSLAEKSGVEINERICTAFLRGCLVHGDVDRVMPFARRMAERWSVPLAGPAAEYAARSLCMGLRAAEAEELVKHANLKSTAELEAAARGYKAAAAASSRLSVCAAPKPAAQASSERPWWEMGASEVVDGSAALHLALADAHAALLDWPKARHRLSLARARIASGLDAKLHADRDGDLGDGGAAGGGDAYTNSGLLSNFLKHREAEAKQELERLQARVDAAEREAACDPERQEDAADAVVGAKRKRADDEAGGGGGGGGAGGPTKKALRKYLKHIERLYARIVLLSDSTTRLASELDESSANSAGGGSAYGLDEESLRRWKMAALLVARLDRLGLSRLQQRCAAGAKTKKKEEALAGGDGESSAAGAGSSSPGAAAAAAELIAKSERRIIKRLRRASSCQCHVRWAKIFGNAQPVRLEICAGAGDWAFAQAQAHAHINWIASEIRGDRIHQISARLRAADLPNLAILGGDAALGLHYHTKPKSFDAIYVTFPEPPSDHTDANNYLMNRRFFTDAFAALSPAGHGLVIISDNPNLLETTAQTARGLMDAPGDPLPFVAKTGTAAGWRRVTGVAGLGAAGVSLVSEGTPEAFGAEGTSSYFDRLWASRSKQRRFYIHLVRES